MVLENVELNYRGEDVRPAFWLNNKGQGILELAKPDIELAYKAGWKKPERFVVKAADNITDLHGVMWKPADFDSTKVYPIISVVYPGPYFGQVPTSFTLEDRCCTRR